MTSVLSSSHSVGLFVAVDSEPFVGSDSVYGFLWFWSLLSFVFSSLSPPFEASEPSCFGILVVAGLKSRLSSDSGLCSLSDWGYGLVVVYVALPLPFPSF